MRWRTDREGLIHDKEYLCEISGSFYDVLLYQDCEQYDGEHYITWSSEFVYWDNQITKWCPLSEIVEFLNTGDSGGEQHEKEDNSCSTN